MLSKIILIVVLFAVTLGIAAYLTLIERKVAAWLQSRGLQPGARVAIMMPNVLQYPVALAAVLLLGARQGRYSKDGRLHAHPPSNIPFLALGAWILTVGWFGFNVMSAQTLTGVTGLVAINSLMALVGGTIAALIMGKNDPGFVHNGPLAGLVAVCAGSDVMHPLGALVTGAVAGILFVWAFTLTQNRWKIDDVLGVWPLHGLCGAWGGVAAGIFGMKALGGMGGVSLASQLIGTAMGIVVAFVGGYVVYGVLKKFIDTYNGLPSNSPDKQDAGKVLRALGVSFAPNGDIHFVPLLDRKSVV